MRIDFQLGWGNLATGGLEVQEVPGNRLSMLAELNLRFLAEKLRACLDSTQADDLALLAQKIVRVGKATVPCSR